MVLPKEEKEVAGGDPKLEYQKEERVATIDLISRINCVQVTVNFVCSILLLLDAQKTYFSMQESLVKEEEPLHEDLPEHNGAAQRDARVQPIKESIP